MIRRAFQSFLIVVAVMAVVFACSRKEAGKSSGTTQTIAPAAAETSPTGTDAMTETVEIQDSRSEAEGGVLTSPKTTTVSPAAAATAKKKTGSTKSRPPGSTQ